MRSIKRLSPISKFVTYEIKWGILSEKWCTLISIKIEILSTNFYADLSLLVFPYNKDK